MTDAPSGIPRREFVKSAIAIGGTSALSACLEWERNSNVAGGAKTDPSHPRGPSDLSSIPERQHAWGDYLVRDPTGNTIQPQHQMLLCLEYTGSIPPTEDERDRLERALETVERAYQRGTGGDPSAAFHDGLLSMIGYGPKYFERFGESLPASVGMQSAEEIVDELDEDATADSFDAILVMMSDYGSISLSVEEALFGDIDELNGLDAVAIDDLFTVTERRTGFQGRGRPAENLDVDGIDENAPLSMGFKSGFADNRPSAAKVSVPDGPFADGTTLMLSRLELELDRWYGENDLDERITAMFSPEHDRETVGETGEALGNHSRLTEEHVENVEEHAKRHGHVGHTQKTARARDDEFEAVINRISEGITTDTERPGFNFGSVQRAMSDFVDTRKAMNSPDLDEYVDDPHHGILDYLETTHRATFLVPPRSRRALPVPSPS